MVISLRTIIAVQRARDALKACWSEGAELDASRLLSEHADAVQDLVIELAGEEALTLPLHQVVDRVREQLPVLLESIHDELDKRTTPRLQELTNMLYAALQAPEQ